MSGYDFELWVQGFMTALKFDAKRTKGDDNGVDIIATLEKGGIQLKYYIQCKFHNRPVGKTPIQEAYTGCRFFGNDGYYLFIVAQIANFVNSNRGQTGIAILKPIFPADR